MSLNWPKTGINHVPAYQVAGIPFVTASVRGELLAQGTPNIVNIKFPFITKSIRVECSGSGFGELRVAFSENGLGDAGTDGGNYFPVAMNGGITFGTPAFPVRCKELFLMNDQTSGNNCGFIVAAGLTNIDVGQIGTMTGSVGGTLIPIFEGVG